MTLNLTNPGSGGGVNPELPTFCGVKKNAP